MAAKKRKDISQEVGKLEDEGQDASQKALDLAKFAEATKSTFESLSPDFTEETSQAIGQASHELQGSIDRNQGEVLQESEDVLDELEQKQKGFEGAIAADKSDISKLNALQAEGDVVGDSKIVQVQDSKQEEIDFLSDLTKDIEVIQDDINQKLNESRQRRQAARLKYKSKSFDNNNQAGSSESRGDSHTEAETPLDSLVEDDQNSSEEVTKEKAKKGDTNKAAKAAKDQIITKFNLKGGHGHTRHGYQTTREEQQTRLLTGITPDGEDSPTGEASRFLDVQSEALAIKKAEAILNKLPPPGQHIPKSLVKGLEVKKKTGRISFFVEARPELNSFGESGKILTRNPDTFDWKELNEVIFVFEPNTAKNGWKLVTYFPKQNKLISP